MGIPRPWLIGVLAGAVILAVVTGWACEDCDTAARHFLRQLFRAVF